MATIIVLVIILLGVAFFYFKCNVVTALTTTLAALWGCILAFAYYEQLAGLLASQKWAVTWIQSVAYLLIFFFSFLLIRMLSNFLIKGEIDVGQAAKMGVTITCGLLTGAVVSGVLLIALALSPLPPDKLYSRYALNQTIHLDISSPPVINTDGFVASLFSWISRSSLSSQKSFSVLHADYLNRLHLNRYPVSKGIPAVCSVNAIKLPGRNTKPVRLWETPDQPRLTVVRFGISGAPLTKGGAVGNSGKLSFIPAQVQLITKEQDQVGNFTGSGQAVYPIGMIRNGVFETLSLSQEMTEDPRNLGSDRTWWLDFAFRVPSGRQAVLLCFKQNAIVELPKPVTTNDEIEEALNSK